jgi:hypothetical protein
MSAHELYHLVAELPAYLDPQQVAGKSPQWQVTGGNGNLRHSANTSLALQFLANMAINSGL